MSKKIFFQSSLPRSGSTLLQNILGQNPKFYVTPTSGVLELVLGVRYNFSNSLEFQAQDFKLMEKAYLEFCRGGMESYFNSVTDKPYVIDKSRGWGIHYDLLNSFYPNPKIIVMVRDLRSIFSSMEKNFRKNAHLDPKIVNHAEMRGTTTEKRIDIWANSAPVGIAIERLFQMIKEGIDKKVHFVKFEDLCDQPDKEIEKIYQFLELEKFDHDFDNIQQITVEDDSIYGFFGDHKIKSKLEKQKVDFKDILGVNASNWVKSNYKWFYDYFKYY